jgi:hypothetical protein
MKSVLRLRREPLRSGVGSALTGCARRPGATYRGRPAGAEGWKKIQTGGRPGAAAGATLAGGDPPATSRTPAHPPRTNCSPHGSKSKPPPASSDSQEKGRIAPEGVLRGVCFL